LGANGFTVSGLIYPQKIKHIDTIMQGAYRSWEVMENLFFAAFLTHVYQNPSGGWSPPGPAGYRLAALNKCIRKSDLFNDHSIKNSTGVSQKHKRPWKVLKNAHKGTGKLWKSAFCMHPVNKLTRYCQVDL